MTGFVQSQVAEVVTFNWEHRKISQNTAVTIFLLRQHSTALLYKAAHAGCAVVRDNTTVVDVLDKLVMGPRRPPPPTYQSQPPCCETETTHDE